MKPQRLTPIYFSKDSRFLTCFVADAGRVTAWTLALPKGFEFDEKRSEVSGGGPSDVKFQMVTVPRGQTLEYTGHEADGTGYQFTLDAEGVLHERTLNKLTGLLHSRQHKKDQNGTWGWASERASQVTVPESEVRDANTRRQLDAWGDHFGKQLDVSFEEAEKIRQAQATWIALCQKHWSKNSFVAQREKQAVLDDYLAPSLTTELSSLLAQHRLNPSQYDSVESAYWDLNALDQVIEKMVLGQQTESAFPLNILMVAHGIMSSVARLDDNVFVHLSDPPEDPELYRECCRAEKIGFIRSYLRLALKAMKDGTPGFEPPLSRPARAARRPSGITAEPMVMDPALKLKPMVSPSSEPKTAVLRPLGEKEEPILEEKVNSPWGADVDAAPVQRVIDDDSAKQLTDVLTVTLEKCKVQTAEDLNSLDRAMENLKQDQPIGDKLPSHIVSAAKNISQRLIHSAQGFSKAEKISFIQSVLQDMLRQKSDEIRAPLDEKEDALPPPAAPDLFRDICKGLVIVGGLAGLGLVCVGYVVAALCCAVIALIAEAKAQMVISRITPLFQAGYARLNQPREPAVVPGAGARF